MDQVLKLAENYMMQRVMSNHAPLAQANIILIGFPLIIGLFTFITVGLFLSGIYMWLSTMMPVYQVMIIMSGLFLIITLCLSLCFIICNRLKAKKIKRIRQNMINDIINGVQSIDAELSEIEFIQDNPKTSMTLVAILGYLLTPKFTQ